MNWNTYLIAQTLGVATFNTICNATYTTWIWRDEPVLSLARIGSDPP